MTMAFAGCPICPQEMFDVFGALALSGGGSFSVCDNAIKQVLVGHPDLQQVVAGQFFYMPAGADSNANTTCNCVTSDASGNYLLGGELTIAGVGYEAVVRLTPTMAVDTTFGVGGWWLFAPPGSTGIPEIQGIVVQSSGKIVVAGGIGTVGGQRATAARINANGTPDTAFGGTGMVVFSPNGTTQSLGFGSAVQADGKVIICGTAIRTSDSVKVQFATRFNTDGTIDAAYGTSGTALVDCGEVGGGAAWGMKLDSGGLAILGGETQHNAATTTTGSNPVGAILLNATSTTNMSQGQILTIGTGPTQEQVFVQIVNTGTQIQCFPALQFTHAPGEAITWAYGLLTAVRLTTAGILDTTFNTIGYSKQLFGLTVRGLAVALQTDGKILVSGGTITGAGVVGTVTDRLNTNGTLDTTYGASGFGFVSGPSINGITTDPSNNLIVADNPGTLQEVAFRALSTGALDPAFATAGRFSQVPRIMTPNGVARSSSGDLCFAGVGVPSGGIQSFAALRLNSSGVLYT